MSKKVQLLIVCVFSIALIILYIISIQDKKDLTSVYVPTKDCDPQNKKCNVDLEEVSLEISLDRDIYYLKKFDVTIFSISKQNTNIESIKVSFKMMKMNMGDNHFILNKVISEGEKKSWTTSAILPICVSGRADWVSNLEIITQQKRYILEFPIKIKNN